MNDEDRLRRLLVAATPEAPTHLERSVAAVARVRARRRGIATIAGSLVVLAAVVAPFAVRAMSDDSRLPSVAAARPPSCDEVRTPTPLIPGAIQVRFCGIAYGKQYPQDVLVSDVDRLLEQINALPVSAGPTPMDGICSTYFANRGPTLRFGYPDGSTRVVRLDSCPYQAFLVGDIHRGTRTDELAVLGAFVDLVERQRRGQDAPDDVLVPLDCNNPGDRIDSLVSVIGNVPPPDLSRAVLCATREVSRGHTLRSGPITIPEDDLRSLTNDLRKHASHREFASVCGGDLGPWYIIVGQNAWGDRFRLERYCGYFNLGSDGREFWNPSDASTAILDRLASGNQTP